MLKRENKVETQIEIKRYAIISSRRMQCWKLVTWDGYLLLDCDPATNWNISIYSRYYCQNRALILDNNFQREEENTLKSWFNRFLVRCNLSYRKTTHVGQKLHGYLIKAKRNCVAALKTTVSNERCYSSVILSVFVIIDETAAFLDARSKSTVYLTAESTVSLRGSGSSSRRLTVGISVACGGERLPLFLIF